MNASGGHASAPHCRPHPSLLTQELGWTMFLMIVKGYVPRLSLGVSNNLLPLMQVRESRRRKGGGGGGDIALTPSGDDAPHGYEYEPRARPLKARNDPLRDRAMASYHSAPLSRHSLDKKDSAKSKSRGWWTHVLFAPSRPPCCSLDFPQGNIPRQPSRHDSKVRMYKLGRGRGCL